MYGIQELKEMHYDDALKGIGIDIDKDEQYRAAKSVSMLADAFYRKHKNEDDSDFSGNVYSAISTFKKCCGGSNDAVVIMSFMYLDKIFDQEMLIDALMDIPYFSIFTEVIPSWNKYGSEECREWCAKQAADFKKRWLVKKKEIEDKKAMMAEEACGSQI